MRFIRRPIGLGTTVALLSMACTTLSPNGDSLSLEATLSRAVIGVGQTDTLTIRVRNLSPFPFRLTFPSSCQLVPHIEQAPSGVVYPPGAAHACAANLTPLTLPPFGEHVRSYEVRGIPAPSPAEPGIALPPGDYLGYAVLLPNSRTIELRSSSVAFSIR